MSQLIVFPASVPFVLYDVSSEVVSSFLFWFLFCCCVVCFLCHEVEMLTLYVCRLLHFKNTILYCSLLGFVSLFLSVCLGGGECCMFCFVLPCPQNLDMAKTQKCTNALILAVSAVSFTNRVPTCFGAWGGLKRCQVVSTNPLPPPPKKRQNMTKNCPPKVE